MQFGPASCSCMITSRCILRPGETWECHPVGANESLMGCHLLQAHHTMRSLSCWHGRWSVSAADVACAVLWCAVAPPWPADLGSDSPAAQRCKDAAEHAAADTNADTAAAATRTPAATAAAQPTAAAAAAVELSVLRADLEASDAETEQLLAHLALLQRQLSSTAAASGAAAAGGSSSSRRGRTEVGSTAGGSAAELLVSEVEFLREVRRVVVLL